MNKNTTPKTTRGTSASAAERRPAKPAGTSKRLSGVASPQRRKSPTVAKNTAGKGKATATSLPPAIAQPGAATKKDQLVSLLSTEAGADVATLSAALGWQAHTTRAALTRLRQAGYVLEAAKPAGGGAIVYRFAAARTPAGGVE